MSPTAPIVVAGAGVGGLTAALALAARGLPVEVHERREEAEIRSAPGSGLTLWSNASTPLGWLGLGDALLARSERVEAIRNTETSGRLLFRMSTGRHLHPGALPSVSIGRGDLADLLMTACADRGIPVHYGRQVTGWMTAGAGVRVWWAGGETLGRALVGADGIRSAVLTQLRGRPPVVHLGRTVYRGICVPDPELLRLADLEPHVPALFNDPDSGVGGGLYPIGGGRLAWTLSCPAAPGGHDAPGDQRPAALALVGPLPPAVGAAVRLTPAGAVIRTDITYHQWHEHWGEGAVTLLGDAAHAMPNDLGQGACQAVEDGVVLADALASAPDVHSGLRAYERRRVERVKWVHEQSVRVATAKPPRNPVLRRASALATRAFLAAAEKGMWTRMQQPPGGRPAGAGPGRGRPVTADVPRPVTWLSAEEEAWRAKARAVAGDVVAPKVAEMDRAARIDPAVLRGLLDAGLLSIEVPEAYGGSGRSLFDAVLAIEEVAKVDPAVAVLVDVQNMLAVSALLRHGTGEQRRLLPRLATGTVGAYALSERQSGSDAFAVATEAVRDGAGYRLTGRKHWTSGAREAGLFLVFATVPDAGLTAFLVDRDAAGLTVGDPVDKLGVRASSTCELVLDGVPVRERDVLGGAGHGEALAVETLNIGKLGIAAQLVGLADGALAAAGAYAAERTQFGQPIGTYQGVAFPLAQLAAELDAARVVLYTTARLLQHGGTAAERLRSTAVAKLLASQVAERAAAQAVETLGGNGFTTAYPVEKLYRDAKVGKIYEGTSNMQYRTIAATGPRGGAAA